MKRSLIILLAGLISVSCAPSIKRIGYRDKPNEVIQTIPQITYNRTGLDDSSKIGTMIIYNNCPDSESAMDIIIPEGAFIGARAANLYNTKQSSFLFGSYRTYIDFYSDSIPFADSSKYLFHGNADNFIDSIHNKGFQLFLEEYCGFICGGKQRKLDLGQQRIPECAGKRGMGIGCMYMMDESIGLNAKCSYLFADLYENGYDGPAPTFGEVMLHLGAKYNIMKHHTPYHTIALGFQGGLNYDRLTLGSKLAEAVEYASNDTLASFSGPAKGFGWYMGSSFQITMLNRYSANIGLDYEIFKPKFPQSGTLIDGKVVSLYFSAGFII